MLHLHGQFPKIVIGEPQALASNHFSILTSNTMRKNRRNAKQTRQTLEVPKRTYHKLTSMKYWHLHIEVPWIAGGHGLIYSAPGKFWEGPKDRPLFLRTKWIRQECHLQLQN